MKKRRNLIPILGVMLLASLVLGACGTSQPDDPAAEQESSVVETTSEDEHVDEAEHDDDEDAHADDEDEHAEEGEGAEHAHIDVPSEFEGLENPVGGDTDAIAAGAELYATTCASCHGDTGLGDGPAAAALDPHPASFGDAMMMEDMSDGYIFWRITEGGVIEPFNSAMPPWGSTFSEDQIWQLVSFLRTLPGE